MFSQLGPLFRTHLRQAESTDARLEIRRDEKQDHKKKDEQEGEADAGGSLWEDTTSVSVEALRAFLIEFLKTRGDDMPQTQITGDTAFAQPPQPEKRTPINNRAAQAVKAYTSMAGQSQYEPPAQEKSEAEEVDLVSLLKADELRTIHILIHELELLARKGVQTLTIEKADTFLEALVVAVRTEKLKA